MVSSVRVLRLPVSKLSLPAQPGTTASRDTRTHALEATIASQVLPARPKMMEPMATNAELATTAHQVAWKQLASVPEVEAAEATVVVGARKEIAGKEAVGVLVLRKVF